MKREDILGQRIENSKLPIFNTPEMTANLNAALNGKAITKEKECSIGKTKYCFNIKLIPTAFEDGLSGVTISLENITEQKRIENELRTSE